MEHQLISSPYIKKLLIFLINSIQSGLVYLMRKILPVCFFVRRSAEFEDFGDFNRDVLTVHVVVWVDASYFRPATLLFGHPWVSFDSRRACKKNAACFRTLGVMVMELFQKFNFRRVWCSRHRWGNKLVTSHCTRMHIQEPEKGLLGRTTLA